MKRIISRDTARRTLAVAAAIALTCGITASADEPTTDSVLSEINSLDTVWVLLASMLIFFMQPGFAMVEAGFTRSKNTANILMKNFVDFCIGK